jgi:HSP20 family protein
MEREISTTPVPANVYRTEDRMMIAVAMPGLQAGDINVEVSGHGRLLVRGDLRGRLKDWKEVLMEEWQAGGYRRELDLQAPVDGSAGRATYDNGVLVVVLPIAAVTTAGSFQPQAGDLHGDGRMR